MLKYCWRHKKPFLIFLTIVVSLLVYGIFDIIAYQQTTVIDAVVTNIEVIDDSDGTEYATYVSYKHNGGEYSNVRATQSQKLYKIGEKMSIRVSDNQPDKVADDYEGFLATFLGVFILFIGCCVAIRKCAAEDRLHTKKMILDNFVTNCSQGEEEQAVEILVQECMKGFDDVADDIYFSLSDDQQKQLIQTLRKYSGVITNRRVVRSMDREIHQADFAAIVLVVITILSLFFMPLFYAMLFADIAMVALHVRKYPAVIALRKGNYHIVKELCRHKTAEEHYDDGSSYTTYKLYFRGYDAYEVTKGVYETMPPDSEYYLVISNQRPKKIITIYDAGSYVLSDEFCASGDKYVLRHSIKQ